CGKASRRDRESAKEQKTRKPDKDLNTENTETRRATEFRQKGSRDRLAKPPRFIPWSGTPWPSVSPCSSEKDPSTLTPPRTPVCRNAPARGNPAGTSESATRR